MARNRGGRSRIPEGTAPLLVEYVSDAGSHNGYAYSDVGSADSWESANTVVGTDIEWTIEDDGDAEDGSEVTMTIHAYAALVRRARGHCEACIGDGCTRNG
jgi:hypothetical protein